MLVPPRIGLAPLLAAYHPDEQSRLLLGPETLQEEEADFLKVLYAPYASQRFASGRRTHIRVFEWCGGRVVAITRLSDLQDPVSGRSSLEVAIGAWADRAYFDSLVTPCHMVSTWLTAVGRACGSRDPGLDDLDAVLEASLSNDSGTFERIESMFRALSIPAPRPSAAAQQWPRWMRWPSAKGEVPVPTFIVGLREPVSLALSLEVGCTMTDSHLQAVGNRSLDISVEINAETGISEQPSVESLPANGRYRVLADYGVIVFY